MRAVYSNKMKVIYHDEERLILEVKSGNFYTTLVKEVLLLLILLPCFLFMVGTFVAHQKIVSCDKESDKIANCQMTDAYYWNLLRYVATVNNVSQVLLETTTESKPASRDSDRRVEYSVYTAVLVSPSNRATLISKNSDEPNAQEYVKQVKQEFENFLNSEQRNYYFAEGLWGNMAGGLLVITVIPGYLIWITHRPYRGRLIFNKKQRKLISTGECLLGKSVVKNHPWTAIRLVFMTYLEDGSPYYHIELASDISRWDINLKKGYYILKTTGYKKEAETFWESDPNVRILRQFVHSEVK